MKLGRLYEHGLGVTKSLEDAVYWYRKAAGGDDPSGWLVDPVIKAEAEAALSRLGRNLNEHIC